MQPSTLNTLNFTANAVVKSVSLSLGSASINAGTPYNDVLTVNALDADGNTIVGPGNYIDVNGNQVAFTLSVTNSQNGGRGTVIIQGPPRITAPGQATIYAHYDGNWLDHSTITATTTSGSVNVGGAVATLTTIPYATEYAAGGSNPFSIIAGRDGNLWYTINGSNTIGVMTTAGNYTTYSCAPCANPQWMTLGPDGNMWFTENSNGYVDKITPAGIASRVISVGGAGDKRIRVGPDGNLWYSTGSLVGKLSTNGTILGTYPVGITIAGIGFANDGSLWYAAPATTTVGHISTGGALLGSATVSNLGTYPDGIVAGPDGNIWITNYGSSQIDVVTAAGNVTPIALQSGAAPRDIVVGPDGNIWFSESSQNTIGYIAPTSTTPTEFTAANGISALNGASGITVGSDGNIWFTERNISKIAKFVW